MALTARVLFPGQAEGALLRLTEPLSFWGGVDPDRGTIINVRHPQHGAYLGGTVLAVPRLIGSSSSSAIMLELIRNGHAPSALILGNTDAILIVGCLVGRELGYACPPVLRLEPEEIANLESGPYRIEANGSDDSGRVHAVEPTR